MSSLLTPGISTTILISLSVVEMSTKGSLSDDINGLVIVPNIPFPNPPRPSRNGDLTFPNSLTLGLPSGPTVMEYPYTNGPYSRTFAPSGVSYSLTKSLGVLDSNCLIPSSNSLSIRFRISSKLLNTSSKPDLPWKYFLNQSEGSMSQKLIYLIFTYIIFVLRNNLYLTYLV